MSFCFKGEQNFILIKVAKNEFYFCLSFLIISYVVLKSLKQIYFDLFFKRFIVPSSMHLQHHYRKNTQNKIKL